MQFLNVHVLLFGGVTVYNSFYDRDTGPIGGLRAPPPLAPWTLPAAWLLQLAGLAVAWRGSSASAAVYAAAMVFFWLYSRPGIRWKGRPLLSLAAIGISTGVCGFLLGYLHGGPRPLAPALAPSLAVAALILSLFPLSQVYQVEEDARRRDLTFAARYGLRGVRRAYRILFCAGVAVLSASLQAFHAPLGALFLGVGGAAGVAIDRLLGGLATAPDQYGRVMAIKYAASGLFVAFLAGILALQSAYSTLR